MKKELIKFEAGKRAIASEVNHNFELLLDYCEKLEKRIEKLEKKA